MSNMEYYHKEILPDGTLVLVPKADAPTTRAERVAMSQDIQLLINRMAHCDHSGTCRQLPEPYQEPECPSPPKVEF